MSDFDNFFSSRFHWKLKDRVTFCPFTLPLLLGVEVVEDLLCGPQLCYLVSII